MFYHLESCCGNFEADLVHHRGAEDQQGPFVWTLNLVDVLTGWSERLAFDTRPR